MAASGINTVLAVVSIPSNTSDMSLCAPIASLKPVGSLASSFVHRHHQTVALFAPSVVGQFDRI